MGVRADRRLARTARLEQESGEKEIIYLPEDYLIGNFCQDCEHNTRKMINEGQCYQQCLASCRKMVKFSIGAKNNSLVAIMAKCPKAALMLMKMEIDFPETGCK